MKLEEVQRGEYYYFDEDEGDLGYSSKGICHILFIINRETADEQDHFGVRADCQFEIFDGDDQPKNCYFLFANELIRPATDKEKKCFLLRKIK